ncbi:MAG: hypothetical protein MUE98_07755 [Rhodobacteraceae bacterium]|nr:hypothetical protein [Paracoccaceae bacterium]
MHLQMWFHRLGRGAVPDGPLALRDRQGRTALTVALVPAARSRVGDEPAARTFALLLKDAALSAPARVDRAVLAREFGFTPGECDEAELLVQGRDPAELCAILGLSPDTLRKRRQVMRAKLCLDPGVDLVGALRGFAFRLQ